MEIEDKKQWHPVFCSAIELEFREDKEFLQYIREHNVSKKPLQIDLLVIKKDSGIQLRNEIGDFFLGHNVLEYKSPGDDLGIDDLYKVLGYACIYKSETGDTNEVLDSDITITLARENKPIKLLRHLAERYTVEEKSAGIYRINDMLFPLQILVTKKLDPVLHGWLRSLTRSMEYEDAKNLLNHYNNLQDTRDRQNADVIVDFASDINVEVFMQILKESEQMTEAMKELIAPEIVELRIMLNTKDAALAANKQELAANKQELANKDAELAANKQELAANKQELAANKQELAANKQEIERLKQQLEEFKRQQK